MISLDLMELALLGCAAFAGATLQVLTGFGVAVVVMPLLAAMAPETVPGTLLILGIPLAVNNVVYGWRSLNMRSALMISSTRVLGIVAGVALVSSIDNRSLQVVCVAIAVACVVAFFDFQLLSWISWLPAAGTISGFMGAVAGVGGPALAVALRHRCLVEVRATTGLAYLLTTVLTVGLLSVTHEFNRSQINLALLLLPMVGAGALVGNRASHKLGNHRGRGRQLLLAVIVIGTLVLAAQLLV